jgi:undecaprenyl-diphosphatase
MNLSYLQALLLGVLQGLTEFLPISSSGHLALVQHFYGFDPESDAMILFDLAVHLGTVVAVAVVFWGQFAAFFKRFVVECAPSFSGRRVAWRVLGLGVLACVPTVVVGLFFKEQLENAFGSPRFIAMALLVTGSLLWATGKLPRPRRGWRRFGLGRAFLVGCGQAFAILPGISRSGTTIAVGLFTGLRREWAGQFSFFIGIPAICGAAAMHAKDIAEEHGAAALKQMLSGPVIAGAVAATIVGIAALLLLLSALRRAKLHYFAYYCWLVGLVAWFAFAPAKG